MGARVEPSKSVVKWLACGSMDGLGGSGPRKRGDTDIMDSNIARRLADCKLVEITGDPALVLQKITRSSKHGNRNSG
jgi:hypothetical protein